MASTLAEHVSLSKTGNHYVSLHIPQRMGNSAPIAYGGYAIDLGFHAACKAAPNRFHLYSAMGHFLRAVGTEANLTCTPVELRKTRNFVTYRVTVEQKSQSIAELRLCIALTVTDIFSST
ncbi:acyl-CoA dehydrogenase family member 11 [Aspergillus udagawae]|nr:acyl-CoA dehydrogenase family member 11 [Aspergillus udagawae]